MIEKVAEYIQNPQEPSIFTILDKEKGMVKTAGYASEVENYINSLERENGYLYALINALTAGEYYGSNKNGDYFPEEALKARHHTFQDGGYVYKHHVNKDPKKSMGRVIFSHYNDNMKRVEIVVKLKADHPDVVNTLRKISEGQVIKTSMGCFTAGTKVVLDNGTLKNIEDIKIGDEVRTHLGNVKKVISLEPRIYNGRLLTFKVPGKTMPDLTCTEEHPIRVIRKKEEVWLKAQDVKKGDKLIIPKFPKNKTAGYYTISEIEEIGFKGAVFNFEVEDDQSYLVEAGYAVHNCRVPYDVCFSLDTDIYTETGYKKLKDVHIGDKVYDEYHQKPEVIKDNIREVDSYHQLSLFGDFKELKVTKEHPFLSIDSNKFKESNKGNNSKIYFTSLPEAELEFKEAEKLKVGDYLAFYRSVNRKNIYTKEHAKFFGYWLAEGSFIKERNGKYSGMSFSFSLDEDHLVQDLKKCALKIGTTFKYYINEAKYEISCRAYSSDLANIILENFGEYSNGKFIHPRILDHNDEFLKSLLGSYLDGDGSFDSKVQSSRFCTVSEYLSRDLRRLCFTIGIGCSLHKRTIDTTWSKNMYTYIGFISKYDSYSLQDYCHKINIQKKPKKSSRIFIYDNYVLIPIIENKRIDKKLKVKNLQVSKTETYQANEYIVHNCSITKKKAKTRAQYSSYLKNQMNQVLSDGRKVYAINTKPTFFDISLVTIPADPVSSFMKVFGIEKVAEDKHGQINKKIQGDID